MSWDILSSYWDDYEYKDVVETIWSNYESLRDEQMELLKAIDKSKSITTVPYEIKRRWKKIKWEVVGDEFLLRNDFNETITNVRVKHKGKYYLQTLDYKPLKIYDDEGKEIEYQIKILDIPFEDRTYNPIIFQDMNGNNLGPEYFEEYIKNGFLEVWAEEYFTHNNLVFKCYGEMLGLNKPIYDLDKYSKRYYNIVRGIWYVYVNGPTIENIKIGTYLFLDLPIVMNDNVRIEEWYSGYIKLDDGTEWYFNRNYKNHPDYFKGMVVPKYTFLVDSLEIKDYKSHPGWWEDYYYFDHGETIEKYSTLFFHLKGRSFFDRMRDMTVLRNFLDRIVPQYVNYILFVDTSFNDGEPGAPGDPGDEISPGDPGDGDDDYDPDDPETWPPGPGDDDDLEEDPNDPGAGGAAPGADEGIEDAGPWDGDEGYDRRRDKFDPYFDKMAKATIADGPVEFRDYVDYYYSYALQRRQYKFNREIRFDNLGDELSIRIKEGDNEWSVTTY